MINAVFNWVGTLTQLVRTVQLSSADRLRSMLTITCVAMLFCYGDLYAQVTRTRWKAVVDNPTSNDSRGRFELYATANGSETLVSSDFSVKGIDFSTIRINENPDYMRWQSDIYWDNVTYDPFSGAPDKITQNYKFLWRDGQCMGDQSIQCRGDLAKVKSLNANMIRVYGFTSRLKPVRQSDYTPYIPAIRDMDNSNLVARVTHKEFLDECAKNGLYVMVGLYFSEAFWDKNLWDQHYSNEALNNEVAWYDRIYTEVVQEVGNHPAVMGFCISNEEDTPDRIYQDKTQADFFWKQVKGISAVVKAYAPDKLCGMAFTDKAVYNLKAGSYMSFTPNIDFWGVNCYRTSESQMDDLFFEDSSTGLGFSNLSSSAKKPVLLTEFGFNQTSRTINDGSCEGVRSITDQDETVTRRVAWLASSLGGLFIQPQATRRYKMCPGMFYFEFSDEWYKSTQMDGRPCVTNPAAEWIGAYESSPLWPNGSGWIDEGGFGIFSASRADGVANSAPTIVNSSGPNWTYFGPDPKYDKLAPGTNGTSRHHLVDGIRDLYGRLPNNASLLASYKFDGNANDNSGNNRHGTLHGSLSLTMDRFGFPNRAYYFVGADDIIDLPISQSLGNSFTFTAWVRPDDNYGERAIIGSTDAYISMKSGNQYVATRKLIGSGIGTSWGGTDAELYEWTHLALTGDGTTLTLYIDGKPQNTYSGSLAANWEKLTIGKLITVDGGIYGWRGKIDDVNIYKGKLSDTEIASLSADRPLVRYLFNSDANQKARDESGNDLDANLLWDPTPTQDRFGAANGAYSFDGINDQIYQPSLPALGFEYSITAWVYRNDEVAFRREILSGGADAPLTGYFLNTTSGDYNADLSHTKGPAGTAPGFYSGVGRWVHLAFNARGGSVELYVNGVLRDAKLMSPDISAGPLSIGKIYSSWTEPQPWKGKIDEVTIYKRPLFPSEIAGLAADRLVAVPVASYKFDGNANDNSGNNLNGTVTGATLTTDRFGFPNSAYQFDGDDVITTPNLPALGGAYSLSAWVLAYDNNTSRREIISGGSESTSNGYYVYRSNQYHTDISAIYGPVGTAGAESLEWAHIAVVSNGTTLKLYVDGMLQNTTPTSANISQGPLSIGSSFFSNSGSGKWVGKIDDVTIYKGLLSAEDIAAISSDRPVVRYLFNANNIDESGNNRHAVISGASPSTDRFGNINLSYNFDGVNDYASCNYIPALGSEYSITTWVYYDEVIADRREILSGGQTSTNNGYFLYKFGNSYRTDLTNTTGVVNFPGNVSSRWLHVAVVARRNTVDLYVDGKLQSAQMSPNISAGPLSIGRAFYNFADSKYWKGRIDDVTIHKRPLSGSEVAKLASDRPVSAARTAAVEESVSNVEEVEVGKELSFYPNPTKGEVLVSYKNGKVSDLNIQVMDIMGSVLVNVNTTDKEREQGFVTINLKDTHRLNSGVYLLRFVGGNKHLGTKRIVLE